jgi:spoIIIJ-associated protein
MPEVERSAPSVEEAIDQALAELGVSEQEATVEVVQEARGGFLGVGAQPAIVRVRTTSSSHDGASASGAAPASLAEGPPAAGVTDGVVSDAGPSSRGGSGDGEGAPDVGRRPSSATGPEGDRASEETPAVDDQADVAADFLEDVLERMGMDAVVEIADVDDVTYIDIWGEDDEDAIGALIGRRGATLDGLQELVRSVVQRELGERCMVVVDVEDYRKRRRSQLIRVARQAATKARRTGEDQTMEPMSAYERKLVHDAIAEFDGLTTESVGEEPNRRVVVRRERSVGSAAAH